VIHWSGIDNHSFLGALLRWPLRFLPKNTVVRILRGPCKSMKWIAGSSTHGCWLGTYEEDKQRLAAKRIKPGMVVYDIGANAGVYTLLFSKLAGPQGKVYAFEPFFENAAHLFRHLRLNDLVNVTLVQAAVSSRLGMASFQAAPSNSMGKLIDGETSLKIPTVTLDQLIADEGFRPPDIVKMDVEGAEGAVLEGAKNLLKERSAVWMISLHGDEPLERCRIILVENGYRFETLDGQSLPANFKGIDEIVALP
jgi:FkbM family methyltransferase